MKVQTYIHAFLQEEEDEGRPIPNSHLNIFMGYLRSFYTTFRIDEKSNYLELNPYLLTMFVDYLQRNSFYDEDGIVKSVTRLFVSLGYLAKHVRFAMATKRTAKRRRMELTDREVDAAFRQLDRTTFTTNELRKRVRSAKRKENKKKKGGGLGEL